MVSSTAARAGTLASSLSCTCTERPREWCRTWPCGVLEGESPPRNAFCIKVWLHSFNNIPTKLWLALKFYRHNAFHVLTVLFQKHADQALALLQGFSYPHVVATLDVGLSRLLSPSKATKNEALSNMPTHMQASSHIPLEYLWRSVLSFCKRVGAHLSDTCRHTPSFGYPIHGVVE